MATYYPKDGSERRLSGVFTKDYLLIQEGAFDSSASSSAPVFETSTQDFSPKIGERLQIRGDFYRVVEVKPNGEGQIKLVLKKGEKL